NRPMVSSDTFSADAFFSAVLTPRPRGAAIVLLFKAESSLDHVGRGGAGPPRPLSAPRGQGVGDAPAAGMRGWCHGRTRPDRVLVGRRHLDLWEGGGERQ